ncbi:MAG TPA: hypothetical protein VGV38_17410, partial [Pyrinomonadaceae bacterium]|nr:hypothetical protein [Pyrinomonadaceae bacterium]
KEAQQLGEPALVSRATLALAKALLAAGDEARAAELALQSQARFAAAGQKESEWRAWLVAARSSRAAGDEARAREQSAHAESALSGLQQQWGAESFNSYLARPDVRLSRKHLDQLSGRP